PRLCKEHERREQERRTWPRLASRNLPPTEKHDHAERRGEEEANAFEDAGVEREGASGDVLAPLATADESALRRLWAGAEDRHDRRAVDYGENGARRVARSV